MAATPTASPATKAHRRVCPTVSVYTNHEQTDHELSNAQTNLTIHLLEIHAAGLKTALQRNKFNGVPDHAKGRKCPFPTHREPKNKQNLSNQRSSSIRSGGGRKRPCDSRNIGVSKLSQGDQVWGHNTTNCTYKQITCPSTSGRLVQLTHSHLQVLPSSHLHTDKTYQTLSATMDIRILLTN